MDPAALLALSTTFSRFSRLFKQKKRISSFPDAAQHCALCKLTIHVNPDLSVGLEMSLKTGVEAEVRYSPAFFGGRQMAILLGRLSPASRTLRKPPGSHLPTSRRFASLHYPPPDFPGSRCLPTLPPAFKTHFLWLLHLPITFPTLPKAS